MNFKTKFLYFIDNFYYQFSRNIIEEQFSLKKINLAYKTNCSILCDFIPIKLKSNQHLFNDAILSVGVESINSFLPSVQTLRTVKSECFLCLFFDQIALNKIPIETLKVLENCKCLIYNLGFLNLKTLFQKRSIRYQIFYFYLLNNKIFDRIILIDLFDTVFQADPFSLDINFNKLNFNLHDITFFDSKWNSNFVQKCLINYFNKTKDDILTFYYKNIINSGTTWGKKRYILRYLNIFLKYNNPKQFKYLSVNDQSFCNIIIYLEYYPKSEVILHLFNSSFFVFPWKQTNRIKCKKMKFGIYDYNMNNAILIHQYYMNYNFCISINKSCFFINNIDNKYITCKK